MEHTKLKRSFEWRGPEFLYKKKTPLWYAHVGVFFFLIFLLLLWLNNIFGLAVLAFAFWLFLTKANERPRTVDYKIDPLGIHIEDHTIHYETLEGFMVEKVGNNTVVTLDPTDSFTFPITLVVKQADANQVTELLLEHLPMRRNYSLLHKINQHLHY